MGIEVRHQPVRKAAGNFKNDRAASAHKAKLIEAALAGKGHSAWESGVESNACITAWQSRLHAMGKNAESAADSLTKAMDVYMDTDISVYDRLHQQATWLEQS